MTPETLLSFMCTSVWWVSAVSFFGAASLFGGRRDHFSLRAIFSQTCFSMLPHYTRLFYWARASLNGAFSFVLFPPIVWHFWVRHKKSYDLALSILFSFQPIEQGGRRRRNNSPQLKLLHMFTCTLHNCMTLYTLNSVSVRRFFLFYFTPLSLCWGGKHKVVGVVL